ncbi:Trafficking protein particle complex subunit BET5 [Elasticomyces elasticus]|nr:Trafficking protein particle complex subunit BET5 [Elasticomyces elasticus]
MSVYSFYIFDRHTECIYSKRFTQAPPPAPTKSTSALSNGAVSASLRRANKDSDDAKLVFGTIFSLRRMCKQLGGADDQFLSYRTGEYKLHYFETPTQLRLVMLTSPQVGNMRTVLHQIWSTLFVEYVVKSPLAPTEHRGGKGVGNELFEGGLERFMEVVFRPQPQ